MKKYILLAALPLMFLFAACEDDSIDSPHLNVTVDTEEAIDVEDGVPVFKKGSSVKFNIDEKSDMVTFYSGESGAKYEFRDRTQLDGTPYLQFGLEMTDEKTSGLFHVYVSSDFVGMTKERDTDAENIENATWVEITDQCDLPTEITTTPKVTPLIDLSDFKGNPLYVAFRYLRPANKGICRFQVRNLVINNEDGGFLYPITKTSTAGWTAFDFNATGTDDPYNSSGGSGTNRAWDTRNVVKEERMYIGYRSTVVDNDDWVISSAIDLTSVAPDMGEGIKAYDDVRLREFRHIYNTAGVYKVSFIGTNSKNADTRTVVKEVTIKIID